MHTKQNQEKKVIFARNPPGKRSRVSSLPRSTCSQPTNLSSKTFKFQTTRGKDTRMPLLYLFIVGD